MSTTFGPQILDGGKTAFRFWAPSCKTVSLEIEGASPMLMDAIGDGWFRCIAPVGPGARYRFRVAPDLTVPDPASRAQPEDVHGPSMVTSADDYDWKCSDWTGRDWEEAVIYEVHVGVAGGYDALREDLPRIRALGITAIELMPLSEFPGGRNWGYDGVLPFAPESAYGTPAALKQLVDAAHQEGLMIFLDVVYNHFGPDGNYLNAYAGSFFHKGEPTPWGDAIDFSVPQVRDFFAENAIYWLNEFRFDGLRLDAVQAINDRSWLEELPGRIKAQTDPARKIHLILENENNDAELLRSGFDAQWNDDGHNALHALLTGEQEGYYGNFATDSAEDVATVLRDGFLFQGQTSTVSGKPRGMPSADLRPSAFILFLQNHDQIGNRPMGDRLVTLTDPQSFRAAYVLLLLSPQIPMMFMGDDWGSKAPFLFFTSHNDDLGKIVREGRRREFSAFPGFADPERREKIPDPNAASTFDASIPDAAERQTAEGSEWTGLTMQLLALRARHIIPRLRGAWTMETRSLGPAALVARWEMGDGAILSVAINLAGESAMHPHNLAVQLSGEVLYARLPAGGRSMTRDPALASLPPSSVVVCLAMPGESGG